VSGPRHGGPPRDGQGSAGERGAVRASPGGRSAEVPATVAGILRLAAGISEGELPVLVRRLARLDAPPAAPSPGADR
jgi:hypothetical protein